MSDVVTQPASPGPASALTPEQEAEQLRARLRADPDNEALLIRLLQVCRALKNPWEGELCLRRITVVNPDNVEAWQKFAILNNGDEPNVKEAVEMRARFRDAIALHEQGRLDEAEAAYKAIVEKRRTHSAVWNLRVLRLQRQPLPQEAPRVSIYVCCHKPGPALSDGMHRPIHVGKAIAGQEIGHPGDDSGDNISAKNRSYCELTGHYWAWKNDADADYVGLAHYRRLFLLSHISDPTLSRFERKAIPVSAPYEQIVRPDIAQRLIGSADVVVPMPWLFQKPIKVQFISTAPDGHQDDYALLWLLMTEIARRHHPAIHATGLPAVEESGVGFFYNMAVMRRPYFEEYSRFLFDVLERLEGTARSLGIDLFEHRVAGFMAERLMSMYLGYLGRKQGIRIRHVPVMHLI